jgi:hypothetical protein
VVRIIICFGTFGTATLHITVCGPGKWQPALHGRKCKCSAKTSIDQAFRGSNGGETEHQSLMMINWFIIASQEPGRCLCCHGRVKAVVCDSPILTEVLSAYRYLHSSMVASFATSQKKRSLPSPSSSCLSLQDDRSGDSTHTAYRKCVLWNSVVNVSDPNVIASSLPSSTGR